jgi:shikimate dehydrogenase
VNIPDQYAVMGNPIQHSLSPLVHQLFAAQTRQLLQYKPILVEPENFAADVTQFQLSGGKGLNITAPFKLAAFKLVNQHTERAAQCQSVNTIKFLADGSSMGDSTDGFGLINDFKNRAILVKNRHILLFGAGGAIRSVLPALLAQCPARVILTNRSVEKARDLVKEFSPSRLEMLDFTALKHIPFDLVINGTSPGLSEWPGLTLNIHAVGYDLIYGKTITFFQQHMQNLGAKYIFNGLGMLVEQAAEAFYFWRGIRPETKNVISSLSVL